MRFDMRGDYDGYDEDSEENTRKSFHLRRIVGAVVLMMLMVALFSSHRAVNVEDVNKRRAVLLKEKESAPLEDGKADGSLATGMKLQLKPKANIWENENTAANRAPLGMFPFVVAIRYHPAADSDLSPHCTGSLIENNMVLTAAHCLWDGATNAKYPAGHLQVMAGVVRVTDPTAAMQTAVGEELFDHPKFKRNFNMYDVGIIVLATPINAAPPNVIYATLPERAGQAMPAPGGDGPQFYSVGYGDDRYGRNHFLLRYDRSTKILDPTCAELYKGSYSTWSFCVKNQGSTSASPKGSICSGDSGGPLVLAGTNQIWGIGVEGLTTRTGRCDTQPSLYEAVSNYLSFIARVRDPPTIA